MSMTYNWNKKYIDDISDHIFSNYRIVDMWRVLRSELITDRDYMCKHLLYVRKSGLEDPDSEALVFLETEPPSAAIVCLWRDKLWTCNKRPNDQDDNGCMVEITFVTPLDWLSV